MDACPPDGDPVIRAIEKQPKPSRQAPDAAPADLPRVPRLFWAPHPDFADLERFTPGPAGKVLDALGPPPFPKTGFPFIGFLATVYDHVAAHAGPPPPDPPRGPGDP